MGSLIKAGGQAEALTARIVRSNGTQLTNTSIVDIGDGTYALYFNVTTCGLYHIEVWKKAGESHYSQQQVVFLKFCKEYLFTSGVSPR